MHTRHENPLNSPIPPILTTCLLALIASTAFAIPAVPGEVGVFARCESTDAESLLKIDISKTGLPQADDATAETVSVRAEWHTKTGTVIAKILEGGIVDLGREPICEVYRFDAHKTMSLGIEEIGVCFDQRDDGTYAGYLLRRDENGVVTERRMACTYPLEP